MTDETERPAMLWSTAARGRIDTFLEDLGREVHARALDLAAAGGRTVVTEEDARSALEWVIEDLASGELTLE